MLFIVPMLGMLIIFIGLILMFAAAIYHVVWKQK
jgi:hypothetical protein